ncbi:MAG: B12-binding domain-containing protein [Syntrophomonadaceae bacterium]
MQQAVLNGNSDSIESLLDKALREEKLEPLQLINQYLIPGIEEAGQLYDKKEYFLPQLMMAAETMKKAFAFVKPYLKEEEGKAAVLS